MSFFTMILPTILKLLGGFLDGVVKDKEAKDAFLKMVLRLQVKKIVSADMFKDDMAQRDDLRAQHAALHAEKEKTP